MEGTKVSAEALQKALETLNLAVAPAAPEKIEPTAEELAKAEIASELAAAKKKVEELEAKAKAPEIVKAETTTGSDATTTITATVNGNPSDEIIKGLESKVLALGTVIQAKNETEEELKKAVDTVIEQNKTLQSFNEQLAKKIGMLEKQPMERKSVDASVVVKERFEKAENGNNGGVKSLSLSIPSERTQLADILFNEFEKGGAKDGELRKATQLVELGAIGENQIATQRMHNRILRDFNINVVK